MAYVIVWRFRANPERVGEFLAAYSGDGRWSEFFRTGEGYLGTELIDLGGGDYITLDRWETPAHYERFRDRHAQEYAALDESFEALCVREERLGDGQTR